MKRLSNFSEGKRKSPGGRVGGIILANVTARALRGARAPLALAFDLCIARALPASLPFSLHLVISRIESH